jgi:hypothetical protein
VSRISRKSRAVYELRGILWIRNVEAVKNLGGIGRLDA